MKCHLLSNRSGIALRFLLLLIVITGSVGLSGVSAQTDTAEVRMNRLLEIATANAPVYGPVSGDLSLDRSSELYNFQNMAAVDLANFAVHAEMQSPPDGEENDWLHRISFRIGPEPHFRFQVLSNGTWTLKDDATTYASGEVLNLNQEAGTWNTFDLVAVGANGYVAVNGEFLTEIPLDISLEPGRISISSGSKLPDATIQYREFTIWSLEDAGDSQVELLDPSEIGYVASDAEIFAEALANVEDMDPDFGPKRGEFEIENAEDLPLKGAPVETRDFVFQCTFESPLDADEHLWDVGVEFRMGSETAYRLRIDSSQHWYLTLGSSDPFQMGYLADLPTDKGEELLLQLVAVNTKGYVGINGEYAFTLDLSANLQTGSLFIGTTFDVEAIPLGAVVPYSGFSVWALDETS